MFKRQKGFTLSELLVSLAVLGLIAAVSIPSVYNSVKTQREKAVWKETIQLITSIYIEGAMKGHRLGDLHDYVLDHVNATKVCNVNVDSQGCYRFANNERGFEMANGAVFNSISPVSPNDMIEVDINGPLPPNQYGEDRMRLMVCTEASCVGLTRNIVGRVEPRMDQASSLTLYNEIFGGN